MNEEKKDKPVTWEQVADIVGGIITIFVLVTYIMLLIFWVYNRDLYNEVQRGDVPSCISGAPWVWNENNNEVRVIWGGGELFRITSSSTINVINE